MTRRVGFRFECRASGLKDCDIWAEGLGLLSFFCVEANISKDPAPNAASLRHTAGTCNMLKPNKDCKHVPSDAAPTALREPHEKSARP